VRDGIRWHLIEQRPGYYYFSSVLPQIKAARETETQVIWDLCHYGWPDDLDIFSPQFVDRFAGLATAFAHLLRDETDDVPFVCPVNEISFFSWASGEVGCFYPFAEGRGNELKLQLVRAAIAAMDAFLDVSPETRFVHTDPVINVAADPSRPEDRPLAEGYTRAQFDSWDMISGRMHPELGGKEKYLDIVGVNYYPHNQWVYIGLPFNPGYSLSRSSPLYKPFRYILVDVYARYKRPVLVAETGTDDQHARADWLRYIGGEVRAAIRAGVDLQGLCLYPIINFPSWDDEFHLHNGLWDYADERGNREIYVPLARELSRQQEMFERLLNQKRGRQRDQTSDEAA
jgi:beta-glucosidase/6-phospho-beta-glucosidase/beta-galactosidase